MRHFFFSRQVLLKSLLFTQYALTLLGNGRHEAAFLHLLLLLNFANGVQSDLRGLLLLYHFVCVLPNLGKRTRALCAPVHAVFAS